MSADQSNLGFKLEIIEYPERAFLPLILHKGVINNDNKNRSNKHAGIHTKEANHLPQIRHGRNIPIAHTNHSNKGEPERILKAIQVMLILKLRDPKRRGNNKHPNKEDNIDGEGGILLKERLYRIDVAGPTAIHLADPVGTWSLVGRQDEEDREDED